MLRVPGRRVRKRAPGRRRTARARRGRPPRCQPCAARRRADRARGFAAPVRPTENTQSFEARFAVVRSYIQRPIVRLGLVITGVLAVLVAIYAVLGFFMVPRLLRSHLEDFVRGHYARTLTLGEIRFNPFTLTLQMRDFSLPD